MRIAALSGWTTEQKHVVAASFLGWTLDAFDFFLLVFVLRDIAQEFGTQITTVTWAITLTLAMRPITYQVGNLIASVNATLQAGIAIHYGNDYAFALALVAGIVAVAIIILAAVGVEAKGVAFGRDQMASPASARAAPAG
jgi:hypothetical protein